MGDWVMVGEREKGGDGKFSGGFPGGFLAFLFGQVGGSSRNLSYNQPRYLHTPTLVLTLYDVPSIITPRHIAILRLSPVPPKDASKTLDRRPPNRMLLITGSCGQSEMTLLVVNSPPFSLPPVRSNNSRAISTGPSPPSLIDSGLISSPSGQSQTQNLSTRDSFGPLTLGA